jgi:ferrochelatase
VPVAFVSEHSETLVELDIEYSKLAREEGVPDYIRAPTVQSHPSFIAGLAGLVIAALDKTTPISCVPGRLCPAGKICGQAGMPGYA